MVMPNQNTSEILVGWNTRPGAQSQGVPYALQPGRFLVRFEEALTVEGAIAQAAEIFGLIVDHATPVPETTSEWIEFEPNVHHRWIVHVADDANPATRENFDVDPDSEVQFVRPIYRGPGDSDTDVYPIFSSLIVSTDDHAQTDEELVAMGFQVRPAWATLFAELGDRNPEIDHPLLSFSRETGEPRYRYYQLPSGQRTLDTEFFENLAGIASRSDIFSIDFDWARVQPYRDGPTDRSARQENLTLIHAREAWAEIPGDANVRIAVLDSGFDLNHADLGGRFLPQEDHFNAKQFLDGIAHPLLGGGGGGVYDASFTSDSHGTAVAGIIGAIQGNKVGIDGVAEGCKLMPVRLGIEPSSLKCVAGLAWAVFRGARVANMSFELVEPLPVTNDMIEAAEALGLVMVAASGNDGKALGASRNPPVSFPASHPSVLAVGAVDGNKRRVVPSDGVRWGSQFRGGVDVVAPGTGVLTTDVTGSDGVYPGDYIDPGGGGTSAATPHVAALAGMILAVRPGLSAADVRRIIRKTATRLDDHPPGPDGRNEEVGYGLINCFEAVIRAKGDSMADEKRGDIKVSDWADSNDFGFLPDYLKDVLSGQAGFETITSDARNLRPLVCITGTALVPRGHAHPSIGERERRRRNREKADAEAAGDARPVDAWYRLYLNNDLSEWVDFDHDALRHVRAWGFDSSPLGHVSVWLDAGARLGHSVSTSAGGFLSGQFLRQAQMAAQTDGGTQLNSTLEQILSAVSRDGTYSTLARHC